MLHSLRSRFIITHILPILLVLPLAAAMLLYLIETQVLLEGLQEDVQAQAALIADLVNAESDIWLDGEEANIFVARVSTIVANDVVLLDADGNLVASSSPDVALPQIPINGNQTDTAVSYTLFAQSANAIVPILDLQEQLLGYVHVNSTLATASEQFTALRQLMIAALLLELVIAAIIGAYLGTRMAKPITAASTAVSDIAHHGRVQPIPETGSTEVQSLAHAVNTLAEQLHLLEENRRKLLANLVHELGRPLGAMLAAVTALRDGADEDPELRQELLKGIQDHIHIMQPLLDDLAQLGGQVLGTRELNLQPISLSDWLPPLLLPWRASAQEKELSWQANVPDHLPIVHIDSDRFAQAIGNLLSNAIKYTEAGGEVSFTAVAKQDHVQLTVTDTGPGIATEEQQTIFEPFVRSSASQQTRFPQGMGLGLTIARDLVEAHNGSLTLQSELKKGSRFIIKLPLN